MNTSEKILVIGAGGQIGAELTEGLNNLFGVKSVIVSDIKPITSLPYNTFEKLDVLNFEALKMCVKNHNITQIYLLAALLSATGEQNPMLAWQLNMQGLLNVLELAKEKLISKVFWPSSIAVFGSTTPKQNTPQHTIMEPETVYGISKQAGERWCEWYFNKYNVDVRSIRYPGIIGWKTQPGGGTTDYAIHIFYEALKSKQYTCFLDETTELPMIHMDDAIQATLQLMQAPAQNVKIRSSYNLSGLSFSPKTIADEIKKHIPDFKMMYQPDFRQAIANTWPCSINDTNAQQDWGWKPQFNLSALVENMIINLKANV